MVEQCKCGRVLPWENRADNRTPCPDCGSTVRVFTVTIAAETIQMRTSLGMKAKSHGIRRPWYESSAGASWSTHFMKFMDKVRIIDRRGDKYFEQVKDPDTLQVVHHCSESLSEHTGH